jgi:hypothetical protein
VLAGCGRSSATVQKTAEAHLVDGAIAAGLPAEYGEMLLLLTETIASGGGSPPNDDVQAVTGLQATSFADFAKRTASAGAEEVAQ